MDKTYFGDNLRSEKMPGVFKTFVSEDYFQNCISCEKYLLDDDSEYLIEKAFKDNNVEFEYAICMDCAEKLRKSMSQESILKITSYFESQPMFIDRMRSIYSGKDTRDVNSLMSKCMFKGTHVSELKEYQIAAHCRGKNIMISYLPYMMSFEAAEEITELLSKKTKEEMDDFMKQNFDLPPEWEEIFKTRKPVVF